MNTNSQNPITRPTGPVDRVIRFCLENKLVVFLLILFFIGWGTLVAPFDWELGLPRDPVPVDAIPDIGENQQIVFTDWMGRSPQDVEDQITYPMTTALLGVPGVKAIRSFSMFGFSSIYIIFQDDVEFYWSRTRVLEKLNSLPSGVLPEGVSPMLGPDATGLGQVFWYTLEGRDESGNPTGGWDLNELRTAQDWYVRYGLLAAEGVAEVASVGGFVKEYQVDVNPDAMRAFNVSLDEVFNAVRMSNVDVGARSIEVNSVDYVIRGLGFIRSIADIEDSVIKSRDNVPVYVKNVAKVSLGPQQRLGALDKGGAEAVGGVVVVRYGSNPLAGIKNVKARIREMEPGLPKKALVDWTKVTPAGVREFAGANGIAAFGPSGEFDSTAALQWLRDNPEAKAPDWMTISQIKLIPFYDRTSLIYETLGTLETALRDEILITIIVVIVMVLHLRSSMLISGLLPLTVLMCFAAMKTFNVDANIVALSGIAIAIGTIVDMGIIICENILRHMDEAPPDEPTLEIIYRASSEVGGAVLTAIATTVMSFLPVFTMEAAEGKLFKPLAYTKTFALIASVIVALTMIPPFAHLLFSRARKAGEKTEEGPRLFHYLRLTLYGLLGIFGLVLMLTFKWWVGAVVTGFAVFHSVKRHIPGKASKVIVYGTNAVAVIIVGLLLAEHWLPLGPDKGLVKNVIFVGTMIGGLLLFFNLFQYVYPSVLRWCLDHKFTFLLFPFAIVIWGLVIWLGFGKVFEVIPKVAETIGVDGEAIRSSDFWVDSSHAFPGMGKEFMPPLDEGSYLYMPMTMPHASIGESLDAIQKQDMAIRAIPEIESVVGKIGRAESALDPAPVSMVETIVNYKPEYITDKDGRRLHFRIDPHPDGAGDSPGKFARNESGDLVPDPNGEPYRQWRDHIRKPDDIWDEIVKSAQVPGSTSAPRLQPIAARIVMLQSGMRAPMGVKIKGPDLKTIEEVGFQIEKFLKEVPSVEEQAVLADRIIGVPYLEIDINRNAIARYGLSIRMVQDIIEVALGGNRITTTVEGRERYPVRVRYQRELRDQIESIGKILVPGMDGAQIPLDQVSEIKFVRGPQMIRAEDTFLVGYVIFDKKPGYAEVEVVEECLAYLEQKRASGELDLPAGVSYRFAGSYENQIRAEKRLAIVLPLALFIIFLILYFQFKSVPTTLIVFTGIMVAWAGGFQMLWLYSQDWFLDFSIFDTNMRGLFQVRAFNLSVAVWVGFLALFGIASDDGVVIATYLDQSFRARRTSNIKELREATIIAGMRRVRPCLMTTATTILALLPVLTSTGRGSDIMVPMAIPSFGGMTIELLTMFVVPTLYCLVMEIKLGLRMKDDRLDYGDGAPPPSSEQDLLPNHTEDEKDAS